MGLWATKARLEVAATLPVGGGHDKRGHALGCVACEDAAEPEGLVVGMGKHGQQAKFVRGRGRHGNEKIAHAPAAPHAPLPLGVAPRYHRVFPRTGGWNAGRSRS